MCESAPDVADVVAAGSVATHVADEAHQRVLARTIIDPRTELTCTQCQEM